MKQIVTAFLVLAAAIGVFSIAFADNSTLSDAAKDNACYAGGAWEGKCDWPTEAETEWAWNCGWYYARVFDGRLSATQAPADCKFLVTFIPPTAVPFPTSTITPTPFPIPTFFPTTTPLPLR